MDESRGWVVRILEFVDSKGTGGIDGENEEQLEEKSYRVNPE